MITFSNLVCTSPEFKSNKYIEPFYTPYTFDIPMSKLFNTVFILQLLLIIMANGARFYAIKIFFINNDYILESWLHQPKI